MPKIALGLEYDGSAFHGWQIQQNASSVQASLEQALSRLAKCPIRTVCAGRTDTGVHAHSQVVHFETESLLPAKAWIWGSQKYLPPSIRILWAKPVAASFSARHSATARTYQYYLYNHSIRPSLLRQYLTWHYPPLRLLAMQKAATLLLGEHDFSAFRGPHCQSKSPIRLVERCELVQAGALFRLEIKANAFLHHMVRNIVGVLLKIGQGDAPWTWAHTVLMSRQRPKATLCAPPNGLYLARVDYPALWALPETPLRPQDPWPWAYATESEDSR